MTDFSITDLVVGDGKPAERGALITAHYTGYLADGTVFDSSHHRGQVFETVIGTGRVIKGWDLGVLGSEIGEKLLAKWGISVDLPACEPMRVGGKRRLIVPAFLGYGERAVGKIPPNSDLVFEIELIDVKTRG
ncbi:FKBP-type peptidyl-prolyl cis-trans isomerase [Moraxella equi]|uniref:Peptidyl-prolyl cis-trans isomerase n=1 Tax=Moraxella equi TaxID=60442 RepID=A0A378QRH3_9GAMM|nr:FKBP-type peptidyl-prolyl cis-trans isomerase [Moraxella equi]OPH38322.1 FKBP-type peptidylprolyl isomerase [Moraxella equi]STZ03475.1 FK506-binding protein [Moraxella equi]